MRTPSKGQPAEETAGHVAGLPHAKAHLESIPAPIAPLELPMGTTDLLLFGGSFDPVHRWHIEGPLRVAAAVARARGESLFGGARADCSVCVVYIPAASSPLKGYGPRGSGADRVAMLEAALNAARAGHTSASHANPSHANPSHASSNHALSHSLSHAVVPQRDQSAGPIPAIQSTPHVAALGSVSHVVVHTRIWEDELRRAAWAIAHSSGSVHAGSVGQTSLGVPSPSYTIDTVRRLRTLVGADITLRLIIGVDQALNFHAWREARALLALAEPLVMPRDGIDHGDALVGALLYLADRTGWNDEEVQAWRQRLVTGVPLEPVASTHIRDLLAQDKSTPMLDPSVRAYIDAKGLYR